VADHQGIGDQRRMIPAVLLCFEFRPSRRNSCWPYPRSANSGPQIPPGSLGLWCGGTARASNRRDVWTGVGGANSGGTLLCWGMPDGLSPIRGKYFQGRCRQAGTRLCARSDSSAGRGRCTADSRCPTTRPQAPLARFGELSVNRRRTLAQERRAILARLACDGMRV
jgi:hypothetical protein